MAELQHKTPRNPRRTNLRRLPGWHRTGEIFYAVGFLTEYWLICLGRKAAAAAHAARDAALYLIWLLLAPVLELGQAFCTALAGPHPLRQLVPWLAPCAAGVILWAVVAHGLNLHFTLQVEVNGTVVGSVATEQNFDTARADLQARLAAARQLADSDTAALPVLEPTYTLHIGGTPMTELQLTDAILRASGSSIVEGTAVYLDGSLAFVTVEGDHLRCFFNQLQRPWRAPRQSNVRTAFLHEIRLVDGIYLADSVQPYGEIVQQLQSRDLLQVKTVCTRVYQEPIPYDQQTVERSDLGFGVVETIQQGVDGTQQLTEEITYVNGVQTAAEVVHIDILTPAVPEITARGTHLAPGMTAELDGHTFIWPGAAVQACKPLDGRQRQPQGRGYCRAARHPHHCLSKRHGGNGHLPQRRFQLWQLCHSGPRGWLPNLVCPHERFCRQAGRCGAAGPNNWLCGGYRVFFRLPLPL